MSDKMRWRYGDTNPVVAAVDAESEIAIGDLLWLDTDDAKPVAALTGAADEAALRAAVAAAFLGVAMQRSRAGDTAPVRTAATGVFEFDCVEDSYELGDLLGVAAAAGPQAENQKLAKAGGAAQAIGRVARREAGAVTRVLVDIRSTVMTGGIAGSVAAG